MITSRVEVGTAVLPVAVVVLVLAVVVLDMLPIIEPVVESVLIACGVVAGGEVRLFVCVVEGLDTVVEFG